MHTPAASPPATRDLEVVGSGDSGVGARGHSQVKRRNSGEILRLSSTDKVDPDLVTAVRALHVDLSRRLPPLEEALAELKPLRLQIPTLQGDIENLSESVSTLYQQLEGDAERMDASEEAEPGAVAGAHSAEDKRRSATTPMRKTLLGQYMHASAHAGVDQEMVDALSRRIEKAEGDAKAATDRYMDFEQLTTILEDRVKELDSDFRAHSKEIDTKLALQQSAEEKENSQAQKVYESWNLENQVDVILAVVQQEMKNVRNDLVGQMKAMSAVVEKAPEVQQYDGKRSSQRGSISTVVSQSSPGRSRSDVPQPNESPSGGSRRREHSGSRSPSGERSEKIQEAEEKIKRLQECYQQCTLKVAGLKSATRHSEQLAQHALEQVKKIASDVAEFGNKTIRNEVRLDYLSLHRDSRPNSTDTHNQGSNPGMQRFLSERHQSKDSKGSNPVENHHRASHDGLPNRDNARKISKAPTNLQIPEGGAAAGAGGASPRSASEQRRLSASGVAGERPQPLHHHRPHHHHTHQPHHPPPSPTHHDTHADVPLRTQEEVDVNTGRIWRLGKRLNDLEGSQHSETTKLKEEILVLEQKIQMISGFLPRRLRRMVDRQLKTKAAEAEGPEDGSPSKKERSVKISDEAPEVRTFTPDPDTSPLPWQVVGEPDQKWSWCLQPRNEMGRDLARYFELLEAEKDEMQVKFQGAVDQLREEVLMRLENVQFREGGMPDDTIGGSEPTTPGWLGSSDIVEKINRRLEKVVAPQIGTLEDRVERLVKDMTDVKKNLDSHQQKKLDKVEFQLIQMRLQVLDKFDPAELSQKLASLEVTGKHHLHLIDGLADQCRKAEASAASKVEFIKARSELTSMKSDLHKLQTEQKETSSVVFNANSKLTTIVMESKTTLEKQLTKVDQEKVPVSEYLYLQEKVLKLESSMRDNRQILSDTAGGSEVNQVVKRIILNMEDKIMVLEKKMDLILEGRTNEAESLHRRDEDAAAEVRQAGRQPIVQASTAPAPDGALESLGNDLSAMSQAVSQLKHDVNLSRVNMDSIREQGLQATELAQRLTILVEGPDGDAGTVLSLNRVQVMVAAAARQLVAGSKWVTQETFDMRIGDLRKECVGFMRQVQAQIEDVQIVPRFQPQLLANAGPKKLPSVMTDRQGARQNLVDQDDVGFGITAKRPSGTAPATVGQLKVFDGRYPKSARR
jgi:hypothetical protein